MLPPPPPAVVVAATAAAAADAGADADADHDAGHGAGPATAPRSRKPRVCSYCKKAAGHNAATCPERAARDIRFPEAAAAERAAKLAAKSKKRLADGQGGRPKKAKPARGSTAYSHLLQPAPRRMKP